MGRKKIQIQPIKEDRSRQVTFLKRRNGLMKKAYELSILCDCEVALVIMTSTNKTIQYSSSDFDTILHRFKQKGIPNEIKSNQDFIKADRFSKSDDDHKSQLSSNRSSLEPDQGLQFISIHQAQIKQEKEEQEVQLKQRQLEQKTKYKSDDDDADEEDEEEEECNDFLITQPLQLSPSQESQETLLDPKTLLDLQNPTTYSTLSIQPHPHHVREMSNEQLGFVYSQNPIPQEQKPTDYMYSNGMDELASLYNQTPCHTPSSDLDTFDHPLWHMEPRTTTIKKCPNMTMDLSVTQELFKYQDDVFPDPRYNPYYNDDFMNLIPSQEDFNNSEKLFQMPLIPSYSTGISMDGKHFTNKRIASFDDYIIPKKIKT